MRKSEEVIDIQAKPTAPTSNTSTKPSNSSTNNHASMKWVSLVLCVIQNSALVLLMRYSRTQPGPRYITSTAVIVAEVLKVIFAFIAAVTGIDGSPPSPGDKVVSEALGYNWETAKVAIPAGLYAIQNNLLYIGLSNLDAPVYQVTNQLKVLTTAVFFVFLLSKKLSPQKWLSLFLLFVGISIVQVQATSSSASRDNSDDDPVLGGVAVTIASITSGFAGVYFEKILKGSSASVWVRNIQMGTFGAIFALIITYTTDFSPITEHGFWYGWNMIVWLVVTVQAVGGLVVAMVMKYADNILKGFASSISIILSSVLSIFLFDFSMSWMFLLGTFIVCVAIYIYQLPD